MKSQKDLTPKQALIVVFVVAVMLMLFNADYLMAGIIGVAGIAAVWFVGKLEKKQDQK
ncbi:MAG: hypothetical protein GXO75_04950 [Calditrichaeota bacterium]|nr:hypothetical protein [Calditrichota bacterium]